MTDLATPPRTGPPAAAAERAGHGWTERIATAGAHGF